MKVYIRNPWPGKKMVGVEYQSSIPPRDSKFWTVISFMGVLGLVFLLIVLKRTYAPSMTQWWRNQAYLEEARKTNSVFPKEPNSPITAKTAELKIPYPKVGDYFQLGFDTLSNFPSDIPPLDGPRRDSHLKAKTPVPTVPLGIQALDGQKISVVGFMIPMMVENNNARTFILAQSRATCCYGVVPRLNQWIYVAMDRGKTVEATMDVPVTVYGTFKVERKFDVQNTGWCLYRMTSEKVELPKKSWL